MDHECFLCLDNVDLSKGKLFRPCLCSHIHENCLNELRVRNNRYIYKCPVCQYEYKIARVWLSKLITNPITISIFTLLLITIIVVVIAWFIRFFTYLLIGVKLTHRAFAVSGKIIWWSVVTIGMITILLALIDENGIDFVNHDLHINYRHNHIVDSFISGVSDILMYGVSLIGFVMFIKNVYNFIQLYSVVLLNNCGQRILEVRLV